MADLLRAFPKSPGSSVWVVQNATKGSEYEVDTEACCCNCRSFEHRRSCKHVEYALYRAKLYSGQRNDAYEAFARELVRAA